MKDRTIVWCLKQKRGIWIIQPNENLTKAYLKKAASALNIMKAAQARADKTASYYATGVELVVLS